VAPSTGLQRLIRHHIEYGQSGRRVQKKKHAVGGWGVSPSPSTHPLKRGVLRQPSLAWLPLPEQPQDDTDGDQADEAIVAHRLNHGDEIADNVAR